MKYAENSSEGETNILQEYFLSKHQFVTFIDTTREILLENKANVLSSEVRLVHEENNVLNYAKRDMFSVVFLKSKNNRGGQYKNRNYN